MLLAASTSCDTIGRPIVGGPEVNNCDAGQRSVNGTCVGVGSFSITLTWDHAGDMDLHVVTPSGTEILFSAPIAEGGTLDVDDRIGMGPENVYWPTSVPNGTYTVCVVPFNISQRTTFEVAVRRDGQVVQTWNGVRDTAASGTCSPLSPHFVGAYEVR